MRLSLSLVRRFVTASFHLRRNIHLGIFLSERRPIHSFEQSYLTRENRQCLLDQSPKVSISLQCPWCRTSLISSPSGPSDANRSFPSGHTPVSQILTRYTNEGGIQENLDILPLITEEAYLDANPSARPARAFMVMCSQGDVGGILELLQTVQEEHEDEPSSMSPADLLRYQDPLDGVKSALHIAIENSQQEIVWLLLWLASSLPDDQFPVEAIRVAGSVNASRQTGAGGVDVRGLRDTQGQTAGAIANAMGGTWTSLLQSGIL
jgi:hypothetical protein